MGVTCSTHGLDELCIHSFRRETCWEKAALLEVVRVRYMNFFSQWLVQPNQGPGLLLSSVIIFHRR
jgi:hypothetical protein